MADLRATARVRDHGATAIRAWLKRGAVPDEARRDIVAAGAWPKPCMLNQLTDGVWMIGLNHRSNSSSGMLATCFARQNTAREMMPSMAEAHRLPDITSADVSGSISIVAIDLRGRLLGPGGHIGGAVFGYLG